MLVSVKVKIIIIAVNKKNKASIAVVSDYNKNTLKYDHLLTLNLHYFTRETKFKNSHIK